MGVKEDRFWSQKDLGSTALPLTNCVALGSFYSFGASVSSSRKLLVSLEVRPMDLGLSEQPLNIFQMFLPFCLCCHCLDFGQILCVII